MSGRAQWLGAVSDFERCFDCKDIRTFTRVKHVRYGWVYFCRLCDDKHEAGRNWWAIGLKLHAEGIFDEVRMENQLAARLRRMLGGFRYLKSVGFGDLGFMSGESAADVLRKLGQFEAVNGSRIQGYKTKEALRDAA